MTGLDEIGFFRSFHHFFSSRSMVGTEIVFVTLTGIVDVDKAQFELL